ncbi:MAG: hypothetical protein K9F98_01385 [Candidatus Planktophila sp.]|jgi:hypothetical protein|nr:hypothetical protein [Candidatus Planktophila sp.]
MTSELGELRSRWNDVLDYVEKEDRVVWLAFFDARLASLEGNVLTLDFSDSRKFGAAHEYSESRERHKKILVNAIAHVANLDVTIAEL